MEVIEGEKAEVSCPGFRKKKKWDPYPESPCMDLGTTPPPPRFSPYLHLAG